MKKILFIASLFLVLAVNAQDRLFTYTYQSNVLNKGQKELEVWSTMKTGHQDYFRGFDHTLEFETGLGSNLQTAFYLNSSYSKGIVTENGIQSVEDDKSFSFANEWKLKLTDPVSNPIGSAVYVEYTLSPAEVELEGKLIFDKQIGKTVQALNISGEYEFVNELVPVNSLIEVQKGHEVKLNLNYGLAWQLNKHFSVGLEAYNNNLFRNNAFEFSVLSAGPCISYYTEGFWVNLSVLPQITDLKSGKLDYTENEKLRTRLLFSFAL
ncbi:MAG: hypothetical protein PHT07_00845 [Paludibacter sp.]|nr:hypothetical protein [Paludibacter sp.]